MKSTNKGLYLSVPTPCYENWSQMTRTAAGRHCSSCNKTVVDFSILSDAAIVAVINNSKGPVCGRFSDDQLDRKILSAVPARNRFVPAMVLTAGLAAGVATTVQAEKNISAPIVQTERVPASSAGSTLLKDTTSSVGAASLPDTTSSEIRSLPEVVITGACQHAYRNMVVGTVSIVERKTIFEKIDYDPVYYSGRHLINKFLKKKRPS
ncbi:hypothetical protein [Chitinophaga sp.]|uniref:hypothetical protein n=1 Tax=Chitinophaga sp. TaxID=1869181 RepID=UPI002F924C0B